MLNIKKESYVFGTDLLTKKSIGSIFLNNPETSPRESRILKAPSISIISFSISTSRLDQLSKILGKRGKFLKIGLPSNFGSPFRNIFIPLFWSAVLTISLKLSSFIPFFCCW